MDRIGLIRRGGQLSPPSVLERVKAATAAIPGARGGGLVVDLIEISAEARRRAREMEHTIEVCRDSVLRRSVAAMEARRQG